MAQTPQVNQMAVTSAEELIAATRNNKVTEINVSADLADLPPLRLLPGQTLGSASDSHAVLSFHADQDGLQLTTPSLVKGVVQDLSATALSVRPGGSIHLISVSGNIETHGHGILPIEILGSIRSLHVRGVSFHTLDGNIVLYRRIVFTEGADLMASAVMVVSGARVWTMKNEFGPCSKFPGFGSLLILEDTSTDEIYALDLQSP